MAYVATEYCVLCEAKTQHVDGKCAQCAEREEAIRKEELRRRREAMTLEERVEAIEEWIDRFRRGYVPPPRF